MKLTRENYRSQEAETFYMSASQWKGWMECPRRTLAGLRGEWKQETSTSMLVGTYVHTALLEPAKLDAFCEQNADQIFKKTKGAGKLSEFVRADEMIARVKRDPVWMRSLNGDHETIKTGMIGGQPWKAQLDVYNWESCFFSDIKTTANFDQSWDKDKRKYVPWYEVRNYWRQFAIYTDLIRQEENSAEFWPCFCPCVTSQPVPDIDLLVFDDARRFRAEISAIEVMIPMVIGWKAANDLAAVPSCGSCDYCKPNKVIEDAKKADSGIEI